MDLNLETLRKSEQIAYLLRCIYEQYGYKRFRMGKFEEYDFYTENKDFLPSGQILTFTDPSGRLMALKPDVTMSIVKNTRATPSAPEKVYYTESVYRVPREAQDYKEIFQIGLEHIGEVTPYTNVEFVGLALKSLACIEDAFVLDLSHMGFLTGLMESIDAPTEAKKALLRCVIAKNAHELELLLGQYGVAAANGERLLALTGLGGDMRETLDKARALCVNDSMRAAVEELASICAVLGKSPEGQALRLDFSIAGDLKYYNGLMLRGYVKSVPRAILFGGRYDYLLSRMGKPELQAVGFGINVDEVERCLKSPPPPGCDAVVLYDKTTDLAELHRMAESLITEGSRVCVATAVPENAADARLFYLTEKNPREVDT